MPELPEVETTRRGIEPHLLGQRVTDVVVRNRQLRWPVPAGLKATLAGQKVHAVERRAKYLLLRMESGTLILHLGMSGSLRIVPLGTAADKHDHVDIVFANKQILRLRDPRRFGAVLWTRADPAQHKLLQHLGPEPLETDFDGDYLYHRSRKRKQAIKTFIMDSRIVVGVGNIYASEALFLAGIHPATAAGRISQPRYARLTESIRQVLQAAIAQGGTTLRDFTSSDGKPGYFAQSLHVYGRADEACAECGSTIRQIQQGQRSTWYCPRCQR